LSTVIPSLRLGFAGTPEFAVPALDALRRTHRICAVFTQPDRPAGRGMPLHASPVKALALEHGLCIHQPPSFKATEALAILENLQLDALIVVAYGMLLPPAAMHLPKLGCINIHASLLPRWRGAAPIQRAILAGDATTGVTIMRMDEGLDTGPTLASRVLEIRADDSAKSMHERLARLGADLIVETLAELQAGSLRELPQPSTGITYAAKITKAEALIDWREDAAQVGRRIRAFNPWPIAETRLNGAQLRLWEAQVHADAAPGNLPGSVLAATNDGIDVACGSGVLRILRLQLAGRKVLSAREFIRGQPLDGERFAAP
jgi:methionyl-tRNA formyltransferase